MRRAGLVMDVGSGDGLPSWVQSIITLIGGGAIVQGLNWFSSHRKNQAEADKFSAEAKQALSEITDKELQAILKFYAEETARLRQEQQDADAKCQRRLDEMRAEYMARIETMEQAHRDREAQTSAQFAELRGIVAKFEQFKGFGI